MSATEDQLVGPYWVNITPMPSKGSLVTAWTFNVIISALISHTDADEAIIHSDREEQKG